MPSTIGRETLDRSDEHTRHRDARTTQRPMNPVKSRSVYRYFEPADTFVQILVCDAGAIDLEPQPSLNRAAYRKLVVETCMPELKGELRAHLERLLPDDPLLAEDLLYQLCVEVNPALDIHTVRLRADARAEAAIETAPKKKPDAPSPDDFHDRLRRRSRDLEKRMLRRIVGQDAAVGAIVRAVDKCSAGLAAAGRPLGSFLFLGRTGTGKTELARSLAAELFGTDKHRGIVRIDCSEFALAHEYSKLIGSPPGYVGHEDGGQLTEAVFKNPETVVLFDEIEKAHPRMHNLLLAILEDGVLTDNKGRHVSFDRTLVLLTSNAGASEMVAARRTVGFEREPMLGRGRLQDIALEALERQFSPEFLGRLDETIVFNELDVRAAQQIAQRQLTDLAARARKRNLRVAFTPAVARWIAQRGFSPEYGARELRRVIQREIETPLAHVLIDGDLSPSALIRVRVESDRPQFDAEA
jgi:ATP-dependent Clp protease ATP-binding subunit ClpA